MACSIPSRSFVLALLGGVGVNDIGPKTLQRPGEGQVLPEVHLVAQRGAVLCLDACVAQQRLEHHLTVQRGGGKTINIISPGILEEKKDLTSYGSRNKM